LIVKGKFKQWGSTIPPVSNLDEERSYAISIDPSQSPTFATTGRWESV